MERKGRDGSRFSLHFPEIFRFVVKTLKILTEWKDVKTGKDID